MPVMGDKTGANNSEIGAERVTFIGKSEVFGWNWGVAGRVSLRKFGYLHIQWCRMIYWLCNGSWNVCYCWVNGLSARPWDQFKGKKP
jgi:hypothetical protein